MMQIKPINRVIVKQIGANKYPQLVKIVLPGYRPTFSALAHFSNIGPWVVTLPLGSIKADIPVLADRTRLFLFSTARRMVIANV